MRADRPAVTKARKTRQSARPASRSQTPRSADTAAQSAALLPDRLANGLDIVSIGINPSLYSVKRGYHFARPGNRFWPAFNAAGLVAEPIEPGKTALLRLLRRYRIGFTDIVRRPTARADQLSDEDFRVGARALQRKLLRLQPRIAWFQGITAYSKYLQHTAGVKRPVKSGLQAEKIGATQVFVTPNPSGANPAANPRALLEYFIALRKLRDSGCV